MNSLELAHLQADGNEWHARKARLILQERGNQTKSTPSEGKAREFLLRTLTEHEDVRIKLRALWTLHIMRDGLSENMLQKLLEHKEEHLRLWATRLLADDGKTPLNQSINREARLAAKESSGLVQLFFASALHQFSERKKMATGHTASQQRSFRGRSCAATNDLVRNRTSSRWQPSKGSRVGRGDPNA